MEKSSKRQASDVEEQQKTGERRERARVKRVMGKSVRDKRMVEKSSKRHANDGKEQETDRQMMGKSERHRRVTGKSKRERERHR